MKFEAFGGLRNVECKNAGCYEPIPLPSQSLLEPTAYQLTKGADVPPVYLACMQCGHVYGYILSEVRYHGVGHTLGQDPKGELHHRAIELLCGPVCKAPATIHIPTYIDGDEDSLSAFVSRLTLAEAFCKHGQRIQKVLPLHPHILRYD